MTTSDLSTHSLASTNWEASLSDARWKVRQMKKSIPLSSPRCTQVILAGVIAGMLCLWAGSSAFGTGKRAIDLMRAVGKLRLCGPMSLHLPLDIDMPLSTCGANWIGFPLKLSKEGVRVLRHAHVIVCVCVVFSSGCLEKLGLQANQQENRHFGGPPSLTHPRIHNVLVSPGSRRCIPRCSAWALEAEHELWTKAWSPCPFCRVCILLLGVLSITISANVNWAPCRWGEKKGDLHCLGYYLAILTPNNTDISRETQTGWYH